MTNVISFAELIGKAPTVHKFPIHNRVILYTSPTLAAKAAARKVQEAQEAGGLTLLTVSEFAYDLLRAQRYEDGEAVTDEWLEGVPFGDFLHFQQFLENPANPGEKPDSANPLTLSGFQGHTIILPPVTLGDYKAFGDYLKPGDKTGDDFLLEQVGKAFDNATLEDGSALPDGLFNSLTEDEASALINFWMNRQREELKKADEMPETGGKKKTVSGQKQPRRSSKPTASQSSKDTPTTSGT